MKRMNKILTICLCMLFILTSVMTGFYIFGDNKNKNSNENNDNGMITPSYPSDYDDMIYYAGDDEETGSAAAPKEMKGGAIYLEPGSTLEFDGTIENYEGYYGGAIYVSSGATFTMTGGNIDYNYSMYGGAIYVEKNGVCNLNGGTISNNKAENAPAIYVESGATLNIGGKTVLKNNKFIEWESTEVNYYVDGVLSKTSMQNTAALNLNNAPLDYTQCCGYFIDEDLSIAV